MEPPSAKKDFQSECSERPGIQSRELGYYANMIQFRDEMISPEGKDEKHFICKRKCIISRHLDKGRKKMHLKQVNK